MAEASQICSVGPCDQPRVPNSYYCPKHGPKRSAALPPATAAGGWTAPPAQPAKPGGGKGPLIAACIVGATVVAAIAIAAARSGDGSGSDSSSGSALPCDATCQSSIGAENSSYLASLSAAVASEQAPGAAVLAWYQTVKPEFDALQTDDQDIADAASTGDVSALAEPCARLKTDVVTFESDPASPDETLRVDLAQAMDHYSTAATECLSADIVSAGNDLTSGNAWIDKAVARIGEIGTGH